MSSKPPLLIEPEREPWKPSRRFFFFSAAAALAGTMLPDVGLKPFGLQVNAFRIDEAWKTAAWTGNLWIQRPNKVGVIRGIKDTFISEDLEDSRRRYMLTKHAPVDQTIR